MKKLIIVFTAVLLSHILTAQTTIIPDANFEQALIDLGYDTGTPDGSLPTANISSVTSLNVSGSNGIPGTISDLTGIEDFASLTYLNCGWNQLATLDVSQNTALTYLNCYLNQLSSLDISNNTALTKLVCYKNQITSLDVSQNLALNELWCWGNQLTILDVSQNVSLTYLYCTANPLTSLDVSQNIALITLKCGGTGLTSLDVSNNSVLTNLVCAYSTLICLNIKNGNNINMEGYDSYSYPLFRAEGNPNLTCIEVDDVAWATANWTSTNGNIDPIASFSTACNNPCTLSTGCQTSFTAYPDTSDSCTIYFYNSSTGASSYVWDFGDGNTSQVSSPAHSYGSNGTYLVMLSGYDSLGNVCDTTSQWVTVNCPGGVSCSVSLTYNIISGCYIHFYATGAVTYSWDLGDGNMGQGPLVPHAYSSSGTYLVKLTGYDGQGIACDTTSQWVTVNCGGCQASFTAYPGGNYPCGAYFSNTSTGASSYLWNFGDGNTSTQATTGYTYSGPGTYYISLYAYDSNGNLCDSTGQWVVVTCPGGSPCQTSFTYSIDSSCTVSFNATGTGATTYSWYFGDGNTGQGSSIVHTYANSGTYFVFIAGYDSLGNQCDTNQTSAQWITVNCPGGSPCNLAPVTPAMFIGNPSCYDSCDGQISVVVTGGTPPYTYSWSNGASTSNVDSLCAGMYAVTVTDANGCDSTRTIPISNPAQLIVSTNGIDESYCSANDGSITVSVSGGTPSYLYSIDCVNFNSSNTFTGLSNGTYTICIIDSVGCQGSVADSIACLSTTGIKGKIAAQEIKASPNPTMGKLHIDLGNAWKEVTLNMFTITGVKVLSAAYNNQQHLYLNLEDLAPGVYLAHIQTPDSKEVLRVVKGK
ncbi:MAG TPA: PKD domain-containing protein [Flavobacteriales bacterium]|nr:PKD domain-containing protein [Flavobacteriales bacterium]